MARSSFEGLAVSAARRYGIPTALFKRLVRFESGYNAGIVSPAGAIGLTQLMPGTAKTLGVDPWDPRSNLFGGAKYLREQFDRFGSWDKALAAYNAGPGAVEKYGGIPPYAETQRYVSGILSGVKLTGARATPKTMTEGFQTLSAPSEPDLSSAVFENLSDPNPIHQLENLTSAVASQGGPGGGTVEATQEPAPPMPAIGNLHVKFEGASLKGTDPRFAHSVAAAAQAVGATAIRLISAKRTPSTNPGVSDSNHLYGHAFDGEALIGGKWVPLGVALKQVAGHFGLRSGDVPGFYKGGPDVEHVDDGFNLKHKQ